MPVAITHGIRVEVESQYIEEKSNPEKKDYFFSYHVKILNEGDEVAQILSRHWIITDETGHREEIHGPGIVGEQPVLDPGESFEYTSFCPLKTPSGTMEGTYQVLLDSGEKFDAVIPLFHLKKEVITYH